MAFEGVKEDVARGGGGGEEEGFAVVGEFEFGPCRWLGRVGDLGRKVAQVEGGKGGFVVVSQVVE